MGVRFCNDRFLMNCCLLSKNVQERQQILAKRDKESAAANLANDLAGSGEEDSEDEDEWTWGTVIRTCTPVEEQVEFPGNT